MAQSMLEFGQDLQELIGATSVTEDQEMFRKEEHATIHIDNFRIYLTLITHGVNSGKVEVRADIKREERLEYNVSTKLPCIMVSPKRSKVALANDIIRRCIIPAEPIIKEYHARLQERREYKAEMRALCHAYTTAFPHVRFRLTDDDMGISVYYNHKGNYFDGTLSPSGISLQRLSLNIEQAGAFFNLVGVHNNDAS
jgi:hypothetical protein